MQLRLDDIARLFDKECSSDVVCTDVSIDSRQVKPGNLFIAIRGENFDGHQFIDDAVSQGAEAVICEQLTPNLDVLQIKVSNTIEALAKLATFYRQTLRDCKVIAVTGSNGKTTVKEMIASILPKPSHGTMGNFNNHIGVPLSVFKLTNEHKYAVFELGANHLGEIAHTVAMVKPHASLVNNIAPAHIAEFGSIENVAKTKGEIYQGLVIGGTAIVNDDDNYAHFWDKDIADKKVLRFSLINKADIYAQDISASQQGHTSFTLVTPSGNIDIKLNLPGEHNIYNALAAATCTYAIGIDLEDIAKGLQSFSGVKGRLTYLEGINNSLIIDDTYNANLLSTLRAIDVLSAQKGKRIFVFGDMKELGDYKEAHHQEVGSYARDKGIDLVMTCGDDSLYASQASNGCHYTDKETLVGDLKAQVDKNTVVLVKGSRSSAMESVVSELLA